MLCKGRFRQQYLRNKSQYYNDKIYSFTLKNSVGYVMRETGGKTCHGDTNSNTRGTGEAEHDVGDDEASETEL